MKTDFLIYAIIPARSGSKGLPDKNIRKINGKPLLAYSIEFARQCDFIDRIFCSTDSSEYAQIAIKYGAEAPFLRSAVASIDSAMEEDILLDLRKSFFLHGIEEPDFVVWLRPTFIFRSISHVKECVEILKNNGAFSSARTVVPAENRLYFLDNGYLVPSFKDGGKSMIRRQDMTPMYKVFSTDIIRFKGNLFNPNFLGNKIYGVKTFDICGLDVDGLLDFDIIRLIVENNLTNTILD
jgi:CMP-N,N'-diacetyllegionaminic acid synthase